MSKVMKQMGMDLNEIDADEVVVKMGDRKLVFSSPQLSKIEAQGKEIFQLQGDYSEESSGVPDEDVELVMEKTNASEEEAREALQDAEDVAEAVMELQ